MTLAAFLVGLLLGAVIAPYVIATCVFLLSLPFAALGFVVKQWRRAWP
jgi:hypothetical protein